MAVDILFLGGTSIDLIQDKPNKKNTPKFFASTGGSITNSSVICARLGLNVAMLSMIGKDPLGDFAKSFLKSSGINTNGILQDPNIRTPLAIANIDKYGNSTYTFYKNSPGESIVPFKCIPKHLLNSCKIFHFGSSFSYQKESHIEAVRYVKLLKKKGVFISFDPNLRPYALKEKDKKGTKNRVLRLLKLANLSKLSETDLRFLTRQKDPKKGLIWLKNRGICEIMLTLGPKGAAYLDKKGNFTKIPAFKIKVADTIGAGDAFTAGLLYKLRRVGGRRFFTNIHTHLSFASAVSAIICTQKGANQALKGLSQVEKFLSKHA